MKKESEFYEEMEYIKTQMNFYSYADFNNQRIILRHLYRNLSDKSKQLYMWYVYSREIHPNHKAMIWDFLNKESLF